jgi:hypothetical protein
VADAGFETPSLGLGNYEYSPIRDSWTFGNSGKNNGFGGGITANGSSFTNENPNAPEGKQVAFLQGTGLIRQTISFPAGSYQVSFDAAQRSFNVQNFQVLIDGRVIGTFTPSGFQYQSYSTSNFTVSVGSHDLTFQGLDSNGGDNTAFIDLVTIH